MTILDITSRINGYRDGEPMISPLNDISATWSLTDGVIDIQVKQPVMLCTPSKSYYWTLHYPNDGSVNENAPPSMTPAQEGQLLDKLSNLEEVWNKEKEVLDTLLKMWSDPTHLTAVSNNNGVTLSHKSKDLWYKYHIETTDPYPTTTAVKVVIDIRVTYIDYKGKCSYNNEVTVSLRGDTEEDEYYILLATFNLPVVDGVLNPVSLLKYLGANPLVGLGTGMQQLSEGLANKYLYTLFPNK